MSATTSRPPIDVDGRQHTDRGYCYGVEDALDGYCVHTASCVSAGNAASGPNTSCVRSDQDGEAMKRDRERAADRRRFTPPEYRSPPLAPGPVLAVRAARGERREAVAVRGRPRGAGGDGTGEWSTWEFLDRVEGQKNWIQEALDNPGGSPRPREVSSEEAAAIVAEFGARVPGYEFQVVRARTVVVEERLA